MMKVWTFPVPVGDGGWEVRDKSSGRWLSPIVSSGGLTLSVPGSEVRARAVSGGQWYDLIGTQGEHGLMVEVTPVSCRQVTILVSGTPAGRKEGLVLVLGIVPVGVDIGTNVVQVPVDIDTIFVRRHAGVASAQSAPVPIPEVAAIVEIAAPHPIPFVPLTKAGMLERLVRDHGEDQAKELYSRFDGLLRGQLRKSGSIEADGREPPAAQGEGPEGED